MSRSYYRFLNHNRGIQRSQWLIYVSAWSQRPSDTMKTMMEAKDDRFGEGAWMKMGMGMRSRFVVDSVMRKAAS